MEKDYYLILGAEGEILTIAYSYLRILTFGLGLVIFSMFFRAILSRRGRNKNSNDYRINWNCVKPNS